MSTVAPRPTVDGGPLLGSTAIGAAATLAALSPLGEALWERLRADAPDHRAARVLPDLGDEDERPAPRRARRDPGAFPEGRVSAVLQGVLGPGGILEPHDVVEHAAEDTPAF